MVLQNIPYICILNSREVLGFLNAGGFTPPFTVQGIDVEQKVGGKLSIYIVPQVNTVHCTVQRHVSHTDGFLYNMSFFFNRSGP